MKKNKITRLRGSGQVVAPGNVALTPQDNSLEEHTARHIILATGSVPMELRKVTLDGETVVSSDEALSFAQVPEQLVVIGAGAIGLEMGSVWSRLASKVTILDFRPQITAFLEVDVSQALRKMLVAEQMTFHHE